MVFWPTGLSARAGRAAPIGLVCYWWARCFLSGSGCDKMRVFKHIVQFPFAIFFARGASMAKLLAGGQRYITLLHGFCGLGQRLGRAG